LIAAVLAIGAIVWIGSGTIGSGNGSAPQDAPAGSAEESTATSETVSGDGEKLFAVRVLRSEEIERANRIVINGRTEPFRTVEVRAETEGRLIELDTYRGKEVEEGDIIAKIALYDREAKLLEAQALLRQRQIEYSASASLAEQGFRSETQHAGARAQLDAARAVVEQQRSAIERTNIRAPFGGMIDAGHLEIGDYVKGGDRVTTLLDLDPILIVGNATETEVGSLTLDGLGGAQLPDGRIVSGTVTYVSSQSGNATRTYRFEIEVDNPNYEIRSGLTARILVEAGRGVAHQIPQSALTLSDDGAIGIKVVEDDDRVAFYEITILEETQDGLWVNGLPPITRVITSGQEFVIPGEKVIAVDSVDGAEAAQVSQSENAEITEDEPGQAGDVNPDAVAEDGEEVAQ
jgi:multidrug efflux system membrane fusion protein